MSGEFSEELNNLIERFEKAPDSRLFAPLADAYRKNGDVDRAIDLCEKGLERYPDYASAHVILGKCFYDKGATERARAEFLRVLELDPENMVALKFMGDILLAEDNREGAVEYFRRILSIDPTNDAVARALKEVQEEFRVKKIDLGDDKTVKKVESPEELATMTLAGIYAAQGYYNKALKIYQEIIMKEPDNSEALEMVEKLQSMMDSSEMERDSAFGDDVLKISLDDVSEQLKESTAGEGGAGVDELVEEEASPERAGAAGRVEEPDREVEEIGGGERVDEPGEAVRPPFEPGAEEEKELEGRPPAENMENFKEWLRKIKGDKEKED